MPEVIGWQTVALRLLLTVVAGLVIGFNRGEHGQPAGMRTTLLVCLAASVAMLQANLLLGTVGKAKDSFVVLDLMRLPLGILTGVGFIGAGAIFRRNDLVRGVTTAATLWFVTVIGLCMGGGQIGLGVVGTALALAVLWALKRLELRIMQEKAALLVVTIATAGPSDADIRARLERAGIDIVNLRQTYVNGEDRRRIVHYNVRWRGLREDTRIPGAVAELADTAGVLQLQWKP